MRKDIELRFKIGAYTPDTMPMERLAQYMGDLAVMLGDPAAVHFVTLEESSTVIVHKVEPEAYPKVQQRVADVQQGSANVLHMNAFRALNKRLADDNASGELKEGTDPSGKLLDFPGKLDRRPEPIAPVKQAGTIDGVVIRLGGKDETVPVQVQDGDALYKCNTSRPIARRLGHHIFGSELRFAGAGIWQRVESGWDLKSFEIHDFDVLDTTPLRKLVSDLRSIRGEWDTVDDAWGETKELRGTWDGVH
jgi:hypothetical protein